MDNLIIEVRARGKKMTIQAKRLKQLLKKMGIVKENGKLSVRTKRNRHGEYGDAVAHVRGLTNEEVKKLREADKYLTIEVYRTGKHSFSIIRDGGSETTIIDIDKLQNKLEKATT